MKINITRGNQGQHALNRVIALAAAVIVSIVFVKQAWTRDIDWMEYIAYSVAMLVSYAPVLAVKLVYALKGLPCDGVPGLTAAKPASISEMVGPEQRKGDAD